MIANKSSFLLGIFLMFAANAIASETDNGWVVLFYGAGDTFGYVNDNVSGNYIDDDLAELATIGSGLHGGHYFTILALSDSTNGGIDDRNTRYYWIFKSGAAGDYDGRPTTTQGNTENDGKVDMDKVAYYDDGTAAGLDIYKDEIFIDRNDDHKYEPDIDVCVWYGQNLGVQCPVDEENPIPFSGIVDLNPHLGPSYGLDELNMADKKNLCEFISNSREKFASYWRYGMLFENDHGGFMYGSFDTHDGIDFNRRYTLNCIEEDEDGMDTDGDLSIEYGIHSPYPEQIDVIFYDQCLRAGMDPIYEMVDETFGNGPYYIVASELKVREAGLNYHDAANYLKQNPSATPEQAAGAMVQYAWALGGGSYDTCAAFALNRVSPTEKDIQNVADDIDYMAQRLVQFEYLDHKYIRNALEDAYYYNLDISLPGYFDAFHGFDLKRFIDEYLEHCNQTNTELIARLQTVSNDLVYGPTNFMIDYRANYYNYAIHGVSSYMPIYWTRVYQTPEQDPLNGNLRNNGAAGAERLPVNPVTHLKQMPGYRCWVDPNWDGPATQPMFFYKNAPGTGQPAAQLADYAKHSPNWCQFIASDITPLHVWSTSPFYPANQATEVSIYTHPVATFAEAIDTNFGGVWLIDEATNELTEVTPYVTRRNVTKSDGYVHGEFEYSPPEPLKCNNPYCVLVGSDFRDTSGNQHDLNGDNFAFGEFNEWHFTTGAW